MLSKKFKAGANQANASSSSIPDQALASFEDTLRHHLSDRLTEVLASHPDMDADADANIIASCDRSRNLLILRGLSNILAGKRREKFYFKYEEAYPVSTDNPVAPFHEALIAMKDEQGQAVSTIELLSALDDARLDHELGSMFRVWLAFAQISDFYSRHEGTARLSINITPSDTDSRFFREALSLGLGLARKTGVQGLILEAVENQRWTPERRVFLQDMRDHGVTLALDDYGAPEGYNDAVALSSFASGANGTPMIIKLDGHLVRGFIDGNDNSVVDRLREIRRIMPQATVVAEWINDAKDAKAFLAKLAPYELENAVHLVQGRTLPSSMRAFLRDMARPEDDKPRPPAP